MVVSKSTIVSVIFFLLVSGLLAQQNRFMVFFKDKAGTSFTVSQPSKFLSSKSLQRRSRQGIEVIDQDLPVSSQYINEVKATGSVVRYASKWFNGILIEATLAQKNLVATLPNVLSVEYVAPGKTGAGGRVKANSKFDGIASTESNQKQNSILGLDAMHVDGITGSGVNIAVFDTGFPNVNTNTAFADIFTSGRLLDSYNFSYGHSNAFVGNEHGAKVFSIIAGNIPATFTGGATGATFLLYASEFDATEYRVEEYNWAFAAERADSAGADIISSSVGYTDFDDASMDYTKAELDGKTSVISRAANYAFQKGIVVINSAGNFGNKPWQLVGTPADSKSVVAVGSIDAKYNRSSFSSIGPTTDGRVKPDVVALGSSTASISPAGNVVYGNGTSFACPLVSSLAAGLLQKWPSLSSVEIKNLLKQSGSMSLSPDNTFGYGVPTYTGIKNIMEFPKNGEGVLIYPNPFDDQLKIAISPHDGSEVSIVLLDAIGRGLLSISYQSIWDFNPYHLDMSNQAAGVYLIKVVNKGKLKVFRIVKK